MDITDQSNVKYVNRGVRFQSDQNYETLGLSMIVKDEEKIILNCLKSVAPYLDYWVIHDTGSSDRTVEVITKFFEDYQNPKGNRIPGEIHQVAWKNFGWNRNQALKIARKRTDYCFLLDADFILNVHDPNFKSKLDSPAYLIRYDGGLDYRQILLIECQYDWKYQGVTHEYIDSYPDKLPSEITNMISINHTFEGSSRAIKFERDAELLEQGIIDEPENSRYYFYLAQSYKDLQKYELAIKNYQKRVEMTDYDEEIFYSQYQIGICRKKRGDDFYQYQGDLLKAFLLRRHRIEPLYQIMEACTNDQTRAEYGYQIGLLGEKLTYPTYDLLFIEKPLYQWIFLDIWATCAEKCGRYQEALDITQRILEENRCPNPEEVKRFENNLKSLEQLKLIDTPNLKVKPFEFVRINQDNHHNRMAVIVQNYNMPERVTRTVNFLRRQPSKTSFDLILVDNGSDLFSPSNFTTVFLTQHVGQTQGFLAGLNYADHLEQTENFKYHSYLLISSHAEIPFQIAENKQFKSMIDKLSNILSNHEQAVAVHPSFTMDSSTNWTNLIHHYQANNQVNRTNLVSHDFVLYQADWFNQNGRLSPKLTTGLGSNLELSYLARSQGKELYLDNSSIVRVIDNLDCRISRNDLSLEELNQKGFQEFTQYATQKYGSNFLQKFEENQIQAEHIPLYYNRTQIDRYIDTLLHFENAEGGHKLLMDHLYHHHQQEYLKKAKNLPIQVLEIGAAEKSYPHMDSTAKLELLCRVYGYQFTSVDSQKATTLRNQQRSIELNQESPKFYDNGFRAKYVSQTGKQFLTDYLNQTNPEPIHYSYLDCINVIASTDDQKTIDLCAKVNLELLQLLIKAVPQGGIVCISYTNPEVDQFLKQNRFTQISDRQKTNSTLYKKT